MRIDFAEVAKEWQAQHKPEDVVNLSLLDELEKGFFKTSSKGV